MQPITISNRFFLHELNTYSNWKEAFWRELTQNSVDAQAQSIRITLKETPEGHTLITFEDNGPGMSEATLRDVYFQLGETSKTSSETIGGHGRARILTCFAHESYEIQTQNLLVRGQGGLYEIENTQPFFAGCKVSITVSAAPLAQLQETLITFLKMCHLPCEVTVNEIPFTEWLVSSQATRTLSFGTLHVSKKDNHRLIARVRGVVMFKNYIDCDVTVVLEIDPERSREILPISRDYVKGEFGTELQKFTAEIAIDNQSIERACLTNKTEVFGKTRIPKRRQKPTETPSTQEQDPVTHLANPQEITIQGRPSFNTSLAAAHQLPLPEGWTPAPQNLPVPNPELAIHFEDAPKQLVAAARRFQPEQIEGTRLKMFRVWEAAVEFFLDFICDKVGDDFTYMAGFLFSDKNLGMNVRLPNQEFLILIQPVSHDGKLAFSIHDYEKIFSVALHECAHICSHGHTEYFANLQTELTTKGLAQFPAFKETLRQAARSANEENNYLKEARKKAEELPL